MILGHFLRIGRVVDLGLHLRNRRRRVRYNINVDLHRNLLHLLLRREFEFQQGRHRLLVTQE